MRNFEKHFYKRTASRGGAATVKWSLIRFRVLSVCATVCVVAAIRFLIDRNGNVVERYSSLTKPEDIEAKIVELLKQ